MIKHLLKILWNRRRSNFLILFEIIGSFLVLAIIATIGVYYYSNYTEPLGFDYRNVWCINTNLADRTKEWTESDTKILNQLYNSLRDLPEIQSIGASRPHAYAPGAWTTFFESGGKTVYASGCNTALNLNDVFNIRISKGRWFNSSDEGARMKIIVVNRAFAEKLFGSDDPVGKVVSAKTPFANSEEQQKYKNSGCRRLFQIKRGIAG